MLAGARAPGLQGMVGGCGDAFTVGAFGIRIGFGVPVSYTEKKET